MHSVSRTATTARRDDRAAGGGAPFRLVAAAALVLLFAGAAAASGSAAGAEISPSVMLIGKFDWELLDDGKGGKWSRCLDQLWRGAERSGSSQVNFVPTHHWLPPHKGGGGGSGVGQYCLMAGRTGKHTCYAWSDALIKEFTNSMRVCFAEALRLGLTIGVRPHLDDGTGNGAWRNGLLFRPADKYAGFSYYDIMLAPVADALRGALEDTQGARGGAKPTVFFAMQGEMSATGMRHPRDWAALAAPLRARVGPLADVKMGVGLNFNRLDDTSSTGQTYGSSRVSWLLWALGVSDLGLGGGGAAGAVPPVDAAGVRALVDGLDFLGVSAYAPFSGAGFKRSELENAAFMLADEMRALGIDLKAAIDAGRLELHYSEFGIGGGGRYSGGAVAATPAEVALRPFFGIYGPYARARDPWALPANGEFRREFYAKAAAWLAEPNMTTYRVSRVFIWSLASWDVLGVYPESTTAEGSYYDAAVGALVRRHNAAVRGIGGGGAAAEYAQAG